MSNQTVFITGSSSGFGLLITHTLIEKGFTVFATMRNLESKNAEQAQQLKEFAEGKSGKLHLLDLDVTEETSIDNAVKQALELEGKIDVLVNNAGIGVGGHTEASTVDQFRKVFEVNLFGIQAILRSVLPSMRENKSGLVVNISSIMGRIVIPFSGAYTSSKYALEGLIESYQYELIGTGVEMSIVEPGGFGTNFFANMMSPADEDRVATYGELAEIPDKMWGSMGEALQGDDAPDPQEVANAVVNLIEAPAGKRQLRVVVDPMMGGVAPKFINQTTGQIQTKLLENFGLGQAASV